MNKKQLRLMGGAGLLGLLAAILGILAGPVGSLGLVSAAGEGLRKLSLSGFWGNLCAWTIVYLLSSPPTLWMLWQRRRRKEHPADLLAVLSSLLLLGAGFALANPTFYPAPLGMTVVWPLAFLMCALSALACWLILLLLHKLEGSGFDLLGYALSLLLVLGAALMVFSAVCSGVSGCAALFRQASAGNSSTAAPLMDAALFGGAIDPNSLTRSTLPLLCALAVLELLPNLLAALVLLWGADLADAMRSGPFGDETAALCEKTAKGCGRVVQLAVLLSLAANLLQLFALPYVATTSFSVNLPLFTLMLSTALFLLCRCFQRGKELQADSDSII